MQRLFTYLFRRLRVREVKTDQQLHLLSSEELAAVQRLERHTMIISAVIGAVMVVVLYVPQYLLPNWFADQPYALPFTDTIIEFSWPSLVYGILLVYAEILMLTALHLFCAHEIAVRTGLFRATSGKAEHTVDQLVRIGMERKDKSLSQYGLNPYQGLSRGAIFMRNVLFSLKATLSNLLVKLLVRRLLGRYALRAVLDFVGLPIFAFWNAWASRQVLREARVVIMGEQLLQTLAKHLPTTLPSEHHALVYDALQFVAISKRDYHSNHSRLAALLFDRFGINPRKQHLLPDDFTDRLEAAPTQLQALCRLIILLGLVLDGHFSVRERRRLQALRAEGVLLVTTDDIQHWCSDFIGGKGIQSLLARFPECITPVAG